MNSKGYNWRKEHNRLWDQLVPPSGQASTLQGELIRISGKLSDQAYRNGNMNWDDDHERMWRYIGTVIGSASLFSREEQCVLKEKIEEIIRDQECPDLSDEGSPYDIVSEMVVAWCMAHPDPIPHKPDPTLRR